MNSDRFNRPRILFIWDQFGPYHMDRCEAVGAALASRAEVIGIELASGSKIYEWAETSAGKNFEKRTLFKAHNVESLRTLNVTFALFREVSQARVTTVFISGYERPSHFAAAILARTLGRTVVVMLDSKQNDKPRRAWLEQLKKILTLPYSGGFAAGRQSANYLRILGLGRRLITLGYDTVSLARIREDAPACETPSWPERYFLVVARHVPKKNLDFLLQAYADYFVNELPKTRRRLVLCGSGPLEVELRQLALNLGIEDSVLFTGFVGQHEIARYMQGALCLLLPSVEEQWGLVVNEALAFDLPLILSSRVGALDSLATHGDNAFVLDPCDKPGWVDAMQRLSRDTSLWYRLSARSTLIAPLGDVAAFVQGALPHLPVELQSLQN